MPKSNTSTWVVTVTAVILAYVLSIGPMARLVDKGQLPEKVILIYYPLIPLLDIPSFRHLMITYLQFWGVRASD